MNKALFSLLGGLFLVVLVTQNLIYLGVPVRISAWLLLGASLVQIWFCRHTIIAWRRICLSGEIWTLAAVIFLSVTFHGSVPIQQGLKSYYGKALPDYLNYVQLAEFLKEEPYGTSEQDIGLRPWLLKPATFLKTQRIGQSIVTADISAWSGTDAKAGYAATVIFFLTMLAIALYVLLRETGIDRFMAGSGALLAALLPAVTRLSLNGYLSQASILFVFPFFASLLRSQNLSAARFTLFSGLTLAYLVAAYSEMAPIGFCTFFLGVIFVRQDKARTKRLILMSAALLIAFLNLSFLRNLIEFLGEQYYLAVNRTNMDHLAPNLLTLRGWSQLTFGVVTGAPLALLFDCCAVLLGILLVAGIFVSRRDRLTFCIILLPALLAISYLAIRTSHSSYPIAKIALSILPFLVGLVFVGLSGFTGQFQHRGIGMLKKLLATLILAAAAAGSVRYYSEVLNNGGLLRIFREPRFLDVCRELEGIKNKRVIVFEGDSLLTPWLCYFARHNDVYVDGRILIGSPVFPNFPFSTVPDLANVDFVATRERVVDLKAPSVPCLAFVDDATGEDRSDGRDRYWLGPPASLRFLAFRTISANLKIRLAPGPEALTLPVNYLLADDQGHASEGEIWANNVDIRRMNFPAGFSRLRLSVKARDGDSNSEPIFPILAELDGLEITDFKQF